MTIKSHIVLIFSLYLGFQCKGQNLVLNPSFEDYDACNGRTSLTDGLILYWQQASLGTVDYFNACSPEANGFSVPHNGYGYQQAFDGQAYSGFIVFRDYFIEYREYPEGKLSQPMDSGKTYLIEFYVSTANASGLMASNIEISFRSDVFFDSSSGLLNLTPDIKNPQSNIISDTMNWTKICGVYLAIGGERYFTIGNFEPLDSSTFIVADTSGSLAKLNYIYLDMISVTEVTSDTLSICTGDSAIIGGNYYHTEGYHTDTSCGVISRYLHILPDTTISNIGTCPLSPFPLHGHYYCCDTTLSYLTTNGHGCDSMVIINLHTRTDCEDTSIAKIQSFVDGNLLQVWYMKEGEILELYDALGNLIGGYSREDFPIDVSRLESGTYVYGIRSDGKRFAQRGKITISH